MRIEAPIPYIRIHPSTRSVQDTQIWVLFYFKKKSFFFFAIIGQFYEYAIQPEVSMTPVIWYFAIICILILMVKKAHHFFIVAL